MFFSACVKYGGLTCAPGYIFTIAESGTDSPPREVIGFLNASDSFIGTCVMTIQPTPPTQPTPPRGKWRGAPTSPPPMPGEMVEQWLEQAAHAPDPHTALDYAQRAIDLRPDDPRVQASVQRSMFQRLVHDAFLAYMAETDRNYVVTFRNSRPVAVPKARAQPEPYPRTTPSERLWRLIGLMLLGLLPAGLGALLLGPLVLPRAVALLTDGHSDAREQRSAWLALVVGGLIGLLGAVRSLVLWVHNIALPRLADQVSRRLTWLVPAFVLLLLLGPH